jgi:hypothetical protein
MVEYGHWEFSYYDEYGIPHFIWIVDGEVRHYAYYGSYGAYNGIQDAYMYSHGGVKNYFTMIWTCTNADLFYNSYTEYGYYESAHGTGVVGMPYAWTQTLSLDKDGYDTPSGSNFCYIGFENVSKNFLNQFENNPNANYGDFIRAFYDHALNDQSCSINQALDRATYDMNTNMVNYDDVPPDQNNDLYLGWWADVDGFEYDWFSRMRIYGDGTNILGVVG